MSLTLRLTNLPWTLTKQDLAKFLSQYTSARVRYVRVIYDKQTGLSRGVGLAAMQDDKLNINLLKRGSIDVEGRNVLITRLNRSDENEAPRSNAQISS